MPKQFILIGSPVAHSLSPLLHKLFATQFGFEIAYEAQEATTDTYLEVITKFMDRGGSGVNVTAPLKTHVFKDLKHLDETARLANAVNTLVVRNDSLLHGYNTDGIGLLCDLKRKSIPIRNAKILILGAGGAVRGILGDILKQTPSSITISNRDISKANKVASEFNLFGNIKVVEPRDLYSVDAELIINATSSTPDYIDILNFANTLCYDLNYTPINTTFMKKALINGALGAYSGLGMLVEQAAAAFTLWHNLRPNTQKTLQMLTQLQAITVQKSAEYGL